MRPGLSCDRRLGAAGERLPADFSEYLRGRHRRAVRTNVGHARRDGLRADVEFVPDWEPGTGDSEVLLINCDDAYLMPPGV